MKFIRILWRRRRPKLDCIAKGRRRSVDWIQLTLRAGVKTVINLQVT
jgi:hypothetical protein